MPKIQLDRGMRGAVMVSRTERTAFEYLVGAHHVAQAWISAEIAKAMKEAVP
jgi:hypothetical protein